MSVGIVFYILFALFFKHVIIDFPLYVGQTDRPRQSHSIRLWAFHILLHGLATFFILYLISVPVLICSLLALIDTAVHSVVDYAANYFYKRYKTDAAFENKFHWVVELDQYLHCLIYVSMAFLLILL